MAYERPPSGFEGHKLFVESADTPHQEAGEEGRPEDGKDDGREDGEEGCEGESGKVACPAGDAVGQTGPDVQAWVDRPEQATLPG